MQTFIILSLAFAVVSLGMVVVAVVALRRSVKALTDVGRQASERIAPLAEELQAEQAVTQLELEALQRRTQEAPREAPRSALPLRGSGASRS